MIPIGAAVVVALLAAGAVSAVWYRVPDRLRSGIPCSDAEARFAAALGRDPLLTQPPPGVTPVSKPPAAEVYQPCEGNGSSSYYGGALRGFTMPSTDRGVAAARAYYRRLTVADGWTVTVRANGDILGTKTIDGTAVVCDVRDMRRADPVHHVRYTAYWIELRYRRLGSHRPMLQTPEDTT
ncbi:hypothetical protein GCM10022220_68290 [Actinocatenispora rupis]|uniref:Uncharacterized protein n=1 Tax=Actinocatenispora rupis TaxID=519421 RepID=A0A8J3J930_9ACTN|nr:hypothetical protein Aru02nite_70970 [Actinocatenispora rupis]